MSVEIIP